MNKIFIVLFAAIFSACNSAESDPPPALGQDLSLSEALKRSSAPDAPSGITGATRKTLKQTERIGSIQFPAGTIIQSVSDGTLVSAQLGAETTILEYTFPSKSSVHFNSKSEIIKAQIPTPAKIAGMDLKTRSNLTFEDGKIILVQTEKPQWIKGYPVQGPVELHPNSMLKKISLGENHKIEGVEHLKGSVIDFTIEGIPVTKETIKLYAQCGDAKNQMERFISRVVKYSCKSDSDCMIQDLHPYPCNSGVVVAKPGMLDSERPKLLELWKAVRNACSLPDERAVSCERLAISAKCVGERCVNGH